MRFSSLLRGISLFLLFLFFATSLEAKNSRLGFILPKDSLSVPLKEKIKPTSFVWTSDIFNSVRIMSKNATNEFFKDRRRKGYYSFSVPIFLKNDTYCLFYSDNHCGYECGEGHLKLYRNEKGKWTEVKTYCKWIS
ncbi:hypothetical protein [Sediminibacterium sp. C3]|uniref:hypothetical protein n=1 Tax=Sediminibacterium sp. C3 TaxID=1267211 RepID=UPI000479E94C|nr:hypothetical protein [Sediminibacterium sp. C3]